MRLNSSVVAGGRSTLFPLLLFVAGATVVPLVACDSTFNGVVPPRRGGNGVVIGPSDAGAQGSGGASATGKGGTVGTGGTTGTGTGGAAGSGATVGAGGTVGAGTGGSSVAQGGAAGGGIGGAAGGGPPLDACTMCEITKCSNPAGWTSPTTPPISLPNYGRLLGAYGVCFAGTGWPVATVDPSTDCGSLAGEYGPTASNGPKAGTAKTTLCQDLLNCLRTSDCNGPPDYQQDYCYCGAGVSDITCLNAQYVPTGACEKQILAALETNSFATSIGSFNDFCLANGAAFEILGFCDANCCPEECLHETADQSYADPTYCNAVGATGGTSGSGGSTATGGVTGTGGVTATGGVTGTGGVTATGGVTGTGGVTATGGVTGTGGTGQTGGSSGTGGTGTGGATGTGGTAGLQNVHFDSDTSHWTGDASTIVTHSSNDAGGSTTSGSLDLSVSGANPNVVAEFGASQCLPVTSGTTYNVQVQILIPGQTASEGGLDLWYYGSSDCSGGVSGTFSLPLSATATWTTDSASTQIPSGVQSVSVRLVVLKPYVEQSAEALFDNVVVAPL
jgi:hypothetical protein